MNQIEQQLLLKLSVTELVKKQDECKHQEWSHWLNTLKTSICTNCGKACAIPHR